MTTRNIVEWSARGSAGTIERVGEYHWIRVLDSFYMYALESDKSVSPHLIRDGFWESWITAWVINNVDEDTLFLDVGANTGYYSFLANSLGATTLAFEPNPTYQKMIHATLMRTHAKGFFLMPTALSNYHGAATLYIPVELHGSASLNDIDAEYETVEVEVPVEPLDSTVLVPGAYRKKQIIKIDAEGEEERILDGGRRFISECSDVTILLEYTPKAYTKNFVSALFDEWSVKAVTHDGGEENVAPEWIEAQTDWVMLVLRPKV